MRTICNAIALSLALAAPAYAQPCLHGAGESPEQAARARQALMAARLVNTLEANQPGSRQGTFLDQEALARALGSAAVAPAGSPPVSLAPGGDVVPGWRLTLELTPKGYWFTIQDTTDPCGFAFISNQGGLIFRAEPLR